MIDIGFSDDNAKSFISRREVDSLQIKIEHLHTRLEDGAGKGSEYLGWLHLPSRKRYTYSAHC